jgi:hypothetical protein
MVLKWFDSAPASAFGKELAGFLLAELTGSLAKRDAKFRTRAEKALAQADRRLRDFKGQQRLNVWKRSRLANAFLWGLKDGGCPDDYASELTRWLTLRL